MLFVSLWFFPARYCEMLKLVVVMKVPAGAVTTIRPVTAPAGTVTVIELFDIDIIVALRVPNFTDVAPAKPEPVMVTLSPTRPVPGEKLLMPGRTLKLVLLVVVPAGDDTVMGAVTAPTGTVVLIIVGERTVNNAFSRQEILLYTGIVSKYKHNS